MKEMNCYLTLVCHRSLEERLLDHFLEHPDWVRGFSVSHLDGGSQKEILASIVEQVRGRSQRVKIQAVMNLQDAHALLQYLKVKEPNPDIAYWIMPVIEFGKLA
jgi:hypothetical protein